MKPINVMILLVTMGLLSLACGPAATPAPPPTPTATVPNRKVTGPASGPGSAEPVVIPVDRQVDRDGITVGVTAVTLTDLEVTVGYWLDCGPHRLEPTKPLVLVVDDEIISGSGGGGTLCDPSHIWHRTFPPLPIGVQQFSLRHGAIIGSSNDEIVLKLPLGDRLSELDPAFGGELDLDLVVESGELAYRFTGLSMGIDRFTLDLEAANEAARSRPLSSPQGELFIEDDQGNQYRGGRSSASYQRPDPTTLVWEQERLDFRGQIDTDATAWRLRAPNLGKIYRGPWQFNIEIPSDVQVPVPVATPTPTSPPTPRPVVVPTAVPHQPGDPTRLTQALALVPLEFSGQLVLFANYATSRSNLGLGPVRSTEDLLGDPQLDIYRLHEGAPAMPASQYGISLRDHIGLDLLVSDLGVWSTDPMRRPNFLVLQERHSAENIAENLLALDYQPAEHQGMTYYRLNEDNVMDIRHPLRTSSLLLNRVAFSEDWLLAAPATDIIEGLIDTRVEDASSLLDSPSHRLLAEVLGPGLVGGAFLTPDWVLETWNASWDRPVERLDRYTSGPDPWGRLSPYTVGLMGYRVQDEAEELVLALYYPDAGAAREDIGELEKRWDTFHEELTTSGPVERPIARHCAPMSTRIIEEADYSVLVGTCPLIEEIEPGRARNGPMVWHMLVEYGELPFLALDLEELRAAAEQRRP